MRIIIFHNGTDQLVFYFVNPELAENVDKLENTPMVLFNCPIQQITYDLHDEAPNTSVWECYQKDCYIAGFDSMSEEEKDQTEPKQRKAAGPKKPHSRRAHWQYYWYGKKDGSEVRYRRLKFVEATFVNFKEAEQLDEIPAVYHPVITF